MSLLRRYLQSEIAELPQAARSVVRVIGDRASACPAMSCAMIEEAEERTRGNGRLTVLTMAISYGGQTGNRRRGAAELAAVCRGWVSLRAEEIDESRRRSRG